MWAQRGSGSDFDRQFLSAACGEILDSEPHLWDLIGHSRRTTDPMLATWVAGKLRAKWPAVWRVGIVREALTVAKALRDWHIENREAAQRGKAIGRAEKLRRRWAWVQDHTRELIAQLERFLVTWADNDCDDSIPADVIAEVRIDLAKLHAALNDAAHHVGLSMPPADAGNWPERGEWSAWLIIGEERTEDLVKDGNKALMRARTEATFARGRALQRLQIEQQQLEKDARAARNRHQVNRIDTLIDAAESRLVDVAVELAEIVEPPADCSELPADERMAALRARITYRDQTEALRNRKKDLTAALRPVARWRGEAIVPSDPALVRFVETLAKLVGLDEDVS